MFTIIGGDGKEYGPVYADQIRTWMAAGRANLDTQAKPVGSTEWRRIGDISELNPSAVSAPPRVVSDAPALPSFDAAAATAGADESTDLETPLAGRGERLLAQLLDNVIFLAVALPGIIMIAVAAARAGFRPGMGAENILTMAGVGAGVLVLGFAAVVLGAVQIWMLVTRGQTLGKRIMDVRIVRLDDESTPGFVHVFVLRALVPGVIGALPWLGWIFTLTDILFIFRDDRRCIHDLIAGTKVIKTK